MASIAEMMALAEYTGNVNNPVPRIAENAVGSYMAGRNQRAKQDRAQLDSILKIMEIQEKVQKSNIEARNQQLNENMMKAMGLLPNGDEEHSSSLSSIWEMMGDGKNPKYVNTPESKLAKMANENFEARPSFSSKNGFSVSFRPKKSAASSAANERNKLSEQREDMKWAEKMARDEEWKKMTKGKKSWEVAQMDARNITVAPDTLAKFLPIAAALRKNDMATYQKLMAGVKPQKPQNPADAIIPNIMTMQMNLLNQAATLDNSINEKKKARTSIWDTFDAPEEEDDEE